MRPLQDRYNQATTGSPLPGQLKIGKIRPPGIRLKFPTFRQRIYLPSVRPTVMDFDPGDAAQAEFGRGSTIEDVFTEQTIATWNFVTVLPVLLCYTQGQPLGNFQGG